ncbi:catalase [Paenibacillus sp. GSMTC-2017]|uniref:catalase n=1 Tax=Paenibacillus sp. GSMTC-2017 TaxID=2794350 RepID=UPI0018D69BAD|nr:catalase [Paenibacillus sp. GSMTC-2017]MBH5318362.1 catalase [Paenibacillus sp. GSMTC-2017]
MGNKKHDGIEQPSSNAKQEQLNTFRVQNDGKPLTTNQGLRVDDDEHSLKAGTRGPTIMEDFHFREKMTHFDHERIPERVVHARGFGAHGVFELYESLSEFTKAKFLTDTSKQTPIFIRFSTVAGSRGSSDTVRDVRGFAVKFYTEEGNYDLVGNNMPVFFIQDAIKFPDFVHAVKPEPPNEIPQASSAHDTFWDFVGTNTESAHMIMWVMSGRALPRSFRMMEGFGVHTFRFINEEGKSHFVKFHWKPKLGIHSLVWDETQKVAGKDPDFNRRDLWDAINEGNFPEFELGVQILKEEDEFSFSFDILDSTKLWPEEVVPVRIIGKMTLNRNTDNFFAETEQVAFHSGHVVPGIDFTNDPLLQGRLFSYTDTQLLRLGGPNFAEIPINRPITPVHNNQRDGMHRMTINPGQVSYHNNGLANNTPSTPPQSDGEYRHHEEKIEGRKIKARSHSFDDHFSQAAMFWHSMSTIEKGQIVDAFRFELGKVLSKEVRQRVVDVFSQVAEELAEQVAVEIGATATKGVAVEPTFISPALSMMNTVKSAATRKVAVLVSNGFSATEINGLLQALTQAKVKAEIVSKTQAPIAGDDGTMLEPKQSLLTAASVLYDAVYIAGGQQSVTELLSDVKSSEFVREAFLHYKTIAAVGEGKELLTAAKVALDNSANNNGALSGILLRTESQSDDTFANSFIESIAQHRHWDRTFHP